MAMTKPVEDMTAADIAAHGIPLAVWVEAKMHAAEHEANGAARMHALSNYARADERARTLHEVLEILRATGEA